MARYHNKKETKKIGDRIQQFRKKEGWNIEDISSMTGFSRSTITKIESGGNTDVSHIIEIAKAIGIHPQEIFNVQIDIKPRYKLTGKRKDRLNLTSKINSIIYETDFFDSPKSVSEVKKWLKEFFQISADPIQISVILLRSVKNKDLRFNKVGRKNLYLKVEE